MRKLLVFVIFKVLFFKIIVVVFKRPFSQEFMKFCLERFEVGIWSSAME